MQSSAIAESRVPAHRKRSTQTRQLHVQACNASIKMLVFQAMKGSSRKFCVLNKTATMVSMFVQESKFFATVWCGDSQTKLMHV